MPRDQVPGSLEGNVKGATMRRVLELVMSGAPLVIIGGLLYAGLFIKPHPSGGVVETPVFERANWLYGASAQDGGKVWLVGANGKILRSLDGGKSWKQQVAQVTANLQDIAAWDDQRAVAVGNGGTVIVTSDGGKSWRTVDVGPFKIASKLLRVKTIPGGHAWTVGEGGNVLHSDNFGNNWSRMVVEEDRAWNDISFEGGNGCMVGEFGRIKVSKDGGATWKEVTGPVKSSLMGVAFKDSNNGVAVGVSGVVIVTRDGGQSWKQEKSGTVEHMFAVTHDGGRWIMVGAKGFIVVSDSGGREWKAIRLSAEDRAWYTSIVKSDGRYYVTGARFAQFRLGPPGWDVAHAL